jgi:archaellum component FlaD/FlaE
MGLADVLSDLYASLTFTDVHAEAPRQEPEESEESEGKDEKSEEINESSEEGQDDAVEEEERAVEEGDVEVEAEEEAEGEEEEEEEEEGEAESDEPEDIKPILEEGMNRLFFPFLQEATDFSHSNVFDLVLVLDCITTVPFL